MRGGSDATVSLPARGLPLTPFEEYMLLDDRPTHPMVILARFDFRDGRPPPALAAAFAATLAAEPLLTARVLRRRGGRPRWVAGPRPELAVGTSAAPAWVAPDPRAGPPLWAEIEERTDGWSLRLAVHHAACDGLGLVGLVERWLGAACGLEQRPRAAERVRAALATRGRVATSWRRFARMAPRLAVGVAGIGQFMARDVAELGSCSAGRPGEPWRPDVVSATLDVADVRGLDHAARAWDVTVNDLLVAAFVAELAPAATRAVTGSAPWIRIAVPTSLRTAADAVLPAANRVSMVFLDRREAEAVDVGALARGLRAEMDLIRDCGLAHIFPLVLEAGRVLPGGLTRVAHRPRPQSTAVFSNLGRCFRRTPLGCGTDLAGDAGQLADWWIVPPVRPGTALAAATHETAGRRTLAFHVDTSRVPLSAAAAWLTALVGRLREIGTLPDPPVPAEGGAPGDRKQAAGRAP